MSELSDFGKDQAARAAGVNTAEGKCPKCGAEPMTAIKYKCLSKYNFIFDEFVESVECVKNQLAQAKETIAELEGELTEAQEQLGHWEATQ